MLQVAVHGEDELALAVVESSGESGSLAEVAAEFDDHDTPINGSNLLQQRKRVVLAAVIDEHQLKVCWVASITAFRRSYSSVTFCSSLWKGTTIEYLSTVL